MKHGDTEARRKIFASRRPSLPGRSHHELRECSSGLCASVVRFHAVTARPRSRVPRLPRVTIVGRPNVGKSTLFNAWLGRRSAITDRRPGTTRDRLHEIAGATGSDGDEIPILLVDTGGLLPGPGRSPVEKAVGAQVRAAVEEADSLVFVVDARAGLHPLDGSVASQVRRSGRPVLLVANKCETDALLVEAENFRALGLGEPVPVSAASRRNIDTVKERLGELIEADSSFARVRPPERLAVLGRKNVGKSTFVNALAGGGRVIVSEAPGTTRDPVNVLIECEGGPFFLVDTAGVARRREGRTGADHFAAAASRKAVKLSDASMLLLEAGAPFGAVERELAGLIARAFKPCVIVVNKWDLIEEGGPGTEEYAGYVSSRLPGLLCAPVVFASALRGERVREAFELTVELAGISAKRISKGKLSEVLRRAVRDHRPPSPQGRSVRLYSARQTSVRPPTVVVRVNDPRRIRATYRRFLAGRMREAWGGEVPVRVLFRRRARS